MSQLQSEMIEDLGLLDETCEVTNNKKYVWKQGNRKFTFNSFPKIVQTEQICSRCKHRNTYTIVVNVPPWYSKIKKPVCVSCGSENSLSNPIDSVPTVIYIGSGWAVNDNALLAAGMPKSQLEKFKDTKF